jgi:hypothetical protein
MSVSSPSMLFKYILLASLETCATVAMPGLGFKPLVEAFGLRPKVEVLHKRQQRLYALIFYSFLLLSSLETCATVAMP